MVVNDMIMTRVIYGRKAKEGGKIPYFVILGMHVQVSGLYRCYSVRRTLQGGNLI